MAIYEYKCPTCGVFEEIQSMKEAPLRECPKCFADVTRIISGGAGFILDVHDAYFDKGLGTMVRSRQHRKQLMKEHNLVEVGNEWKYVDPQAQRLKAQAKKDKEWQDTSEEVLHHLKTQEGEQDTND